MHACVHLGHSHVELAPFDLQFIAMLGQPQLLNFLLRYAACVFSLNLQPSL